MGNRGRRVGTGTIRERPPRRRACSAPRGTLLFRMLAPLCPCLMPSRGRCARKPVFFSRPAALRGCARLVPADSLPEGRPFSWRAAVAVAPVDAGPRRAPSARWGAGDHLPRAASCWSPPQGPIPVPRAPVLRRRQPSVCPLRASQVGGSGWSRSRTDPGPIPDRRGRRWADRGVLLWFSPNRRRHAGSRGGSPAEGPTPDHRMQDARPASGSGDAFPVMPRARSVVSAALPSALR